MIKKFILLLLLLAFLFTVMGCLSLRIENDVDYPAKLFKRAHKKIEKIHATRVRGNKHISGIHVLIYDGEERKLVSFSIPKGTVEFGLNHALKEDDYDLKKHSDKYVDINWEKVKNLDFMRPGLIIEVEDVEQHTHVLIWAD